MCGKFFLRQAEQVDNRLYQHIVFWHGYRYKSNDIRKKSTIMPIERCKKSVLFAPAQRRTMEMNGICDIDITL